jgi:hypothetical protein
MTNKVVINTCYGGFRLSEEGKARLRELNPSLPEGFYEEQIPRHDKYLVQVVEELGVMAGASWGTALEVRVIEGKKYRVCEYDGMEWVETPGTITWLDVRD